MSYKGKVNYVEYEYDFSVDGGAVSSITLSTKADKDPMPLGAIVTNVVIYVVEACTSGGSATVSVGDLASATKYSAATAVGSLTTGALVTATGVPNAIGGSTEQDVIVAIAVAALTAGKIKIMMQYVQGL